jgi:putative ABC transport system substrate-binding protein
MRRRSFIAGLGAESVPLAARAQQQVPAIGYLSTGSPDTFAANLAAFREGLAEAGLVDGQNVAIEYRWAGDQHHSLPELAADLVSRRVAVLYAVANVSAVAAKGASSTIPIVFLTGGDPVELGLVANLNRPGGNATGMTLFLNELAAKRLEILREMVPKASLVAFMINPANPRAKINSRELLAAASMAGQEILVLSASHERDFDRAFATVVQKRVGALLVDGDVLFNAHRDLLVALAARHRVPASYQIRESVVAGGLMSYGPSLTAMHRQGGVYVGRILKGTQPADLPVLRPTKFELAINLKTARELGLTVPPKLLFTADEVIE